MLQSLIDLVLDTGFFYVDWRMIVMWAVVCVLLYLAVFKQFEPLLLVPIAFGALLANLPTEGVVNKPASYLVSPAKGAVVSVFAEKGGKVFAPRVVRQVPAKVSDIALSKETAQSDVAEYFAMLEDVTSAEARKDTFKKSKGIPDLVCVVRPAEGNPQTELEAAEAGAVEAAALCLCGIKGGVTELVILRLLLRVGKDLVGFVYFLEFFLCLSIAWVQIRVVLLGSLSKGAFYFGLGSVFIDSQYFVIICLCHCFPNFLHLPLSREFSYFFLFVPPQGAKANPLWLPASKNLIV